MNNVSTEFLHHIKIFMRFDAFLGNLHSKFFNHMDKLKLDMKFLGSNKSNDKDKIIISAIINMANTLGLTVIAEGVEPKEQAEMLSSFGCNEMQGFYCSKPLPVDEYEKLMITNPNFQTCINNLLVFTAHKQKPPFAKYKFAFIGYKKDTLNKESFFSSQTAFLFKK